MELTDTLEHGILERIPSARINNPVRDVPILSICFLGADGHKLVGLLSDNGIYVSRGSCQNRGVSHVLEAMGLSYEEAGSSLRFSVGRLNTVDEVNYLVEILTRLINSS